MGCCKKKNQGEKGERLEIKNAVAEMGNSLQELEDRIAQISEKVEQKGRHGVGGVTKDKTRKIEGTKSSLI